VRAVLGALAPGVDVVLPEIGGYRQPLAAAYRTTLRATVEELCAADRMNPGSLFERCRVLTLDDAAMLRDPALARWDPGLELVVNLNDPTAYERARTGGAADPGPGGGGRAEPADGAGVDARRADVGRGPGD
jgi:molybdopterin-guanine dinucleotide biosynthesis protein A